MCSCKTKVNFHLGIKKKLKLVNIANHTLANIGEIYSIKMFGKKLRTVSALTLIIFKNDICLI